ncbi:fluoride efflux transporter FluC [Microlunatus capsulatus]|uniref:Fluoride-specific ion channel FluC n=1 Tax=Microlunatus capsulatus TaxID=99117 RepID=A0ABS4Z9L4_9ACTN|nr:CrcB family protein [Microlunatus capsulatus]MBP2417731.1 CrcB protein [Microlunatus capsulatus]
MSATRSLHLRGRSVGLVFVGGALGTGLRALVSAAVPPVSGLPVAVLGVDVVGAFVLGLLLATLHRAGPDEGRRRDLRLLLGTGVLGGFTTYSALAADTAGLADQARVGAALLYAGATLVLGLAAAFAGLRCGGRRGGR